jgi:uncharacterized repeat protein (TIGR01451 family)
VSFFKIKTKKMLTSLPKKANILALLMFVYSAALAQNIRPYTQVFSQNLKGGTAIFGNTMMHIINSSSVNTTKMNETGNASNGQGGIGFSQYGNDNEDMQQANIDATAPPLNVFNNGSNWSYYNTANTDLGTSWRTLSGSLPSTWINAAASFGYAGNGENTDVPGKGNNITNYFLKTITVTNPALYSSFDFTHNYDDGVVVYVNGVEVKRSNMPVGTILFNTLASSNNSTSNEAFSIAASYFIAGNNVIAVEIHQQNSNSNDCLFDMSLNATPTASLVTNATSANLILPAGTNTIKFARLYWGGRIDNAIVTAIPDTLRKIKIRKGASGPYSNAIAPVTSVDQYAITTTEIVYQSYIDIKPFIQTGGAGMYTIADLPCTTGPINGGGHYAGWCIMIAYENTSLPLNSVRIYDGFSKVYNAGAPVTQLVTLTGLNVPNNPLVLSDAVMSTMVWEGDANLAASGANPAGDYIKINNIAVSNAVNPITNFWNGSISKNGAFVTTKNPDYTNQMGIDIDELEVGTGYGILPNSTTVDIEFGTEADQYFPSVFGFAIKMKDPLMILNKAVADANNDGIIQSNEELTYTLSGANSGAGSAYNTFVVDSLPTNVTYVANSLKIVSAPGIPPNTAQSDASGDDFAFKGINIARNYVKFFLGIGATASTGGEMVVGASYNLTFKVKGQVIPGSVINTARITANNLIGDVFTDDGTAIINPAGAPTPVQMTYFTGILKNKEAHLFWATESEVNNDRFEIERSEDGIDFTKIGSVKGNGSSASTINYSYIDAINSSASIIYYRLKSIDFDGKKHNSKIIALRLKGALNNNFSVFPNPFESNLKITLSARKEVSAVCRIISFDGKEVANRKITLQKGDNVIVINDLNNIASGNYLLEVNTGDEKFIQKIMKR